MLLGIGTWLFTSKPTPWALFSKVSLLNMHSIIKSDIWLYSYADNSCWPLTPRKSSFNLPMIFGKSMSSSRLTNIYESVFSKSLWLWGSHFPVLIPFICGWSLERTQACTLMESTYMHVCEHTYTHNHTFFLCQEDSLIKVWEDKRICIKKCKQLNIRKPRSSKSFNHIHKLLMEVLVFSLLILVLFPYLS